MMTQLTNFPLKGDAWVLARGLVIHQERDPVRTRLYEWRGETWHERASGGIELEQLLDLCKGVE